MVASVAAGVTAGAFVAGEVLGSLPPGFGQFANGQAAARADGIATLRGDAGWWPVRAQDGGASECSDNRQPDRGATVR